MNTFGKRKRIGRGRQAAYEDRIAEMAGIVQRMELLMQTTDDADIQRLLRESRDRAERTRLWLIAERDAEYGK